MSPAANARTMKGLYPENYCREKDCLWNTRRSPCRKHPVSPHEEVDPSEAAKFVVSDPNILPSITE